MSFNPDAGTLKLIRELAMKEVSAEEICHRVAEEKKKIYAEMAKKPLLHRLFPFKIVKR